MAKFTGEGLCFDWNEAEQERNAALLQRFGLVATDMSTEPLDSRYTSIAYVAGLTHQQQPFNAAAASPAQALLGMMGMHKTAARGASADAAAAGAVSAAAAGCALDLAALSSLTGLLPSTAEESHAIAKEILAHKQQLQQQPQLVRHREEPSEEELSPPERRQKQRAKQQRPPPRKKKAPGDSDEDWGSEGQAKEPRRRGRPPKQLGRFSRGYDAIKRYRQKKQSMVDGMEATVGCMEKQLSALQEQREALQQRHEVLEAAVAAQDEMLSQLADLKMSVTAGSTTTNSGPQSQASAGRAAAAAAAAAAERDTATGPFRAALAPAREAPESAAAGTGQQKQQQQQEKQPQEQQPRHQPDRQQQQQQPGKSRRPHSAGAGQASSDGSGCYSRQARSSSGAPADAAGADPAVTAAAAAVPAAGGEQAARRADSQSGNDPDTASSSGDWASGSGSLSQRVRHKRWARGKPHEHQRNLALLLASYKHYISECAAIMCVRHIDEQQQPVQHDQSMPGPEPQQQLWPSDVCMEAMPDAPDLLLKSDEQQSTQPLPLLPEQPKDDKLQQQHQQQPPQSVSMQASQPLPSQQVQDLQQQACRLQLGPGSCQSDSVTGATSGGQPLLAFPQMPFSLIEVLSCWRLAREGVVDVSAAAARAGARGGHSSGPLGDLQINLETGQHDYVAPQHWLNAAQEISVSPEQRQQLEAGWELFAAGLDKLNRERAALQQQLAAAVAATGGAERSLQHQQSAGSSGSFSAGQQAAPGLQAAAAPSLSTGVDGSGSAPCGFGDTIAAAPGATAAAQQQEQHRIPSLSSLVAQFDELDRYERLADAVEPNLLQGRAVVNMFGWAMWQVFDDEQVGRMSVRCWPYWPLVRALVACMLGKEHLMFA